MHVYFWVLRENETLLNKHKKRENIDRNSTTLVCFLRSETRVDRVLIKQPVGAKRASLHCLSLKTVHGSCLSNDFKSEGCLDNPA